MASFDIPDVFPMVDEGRKASSPWVAWFSRVHAIASAAQQSGTTAQRPTSGLWIGRRYWDTDLAQAVYVASVRPVVWADWVDPTVATHIANVSNPHAVTKTQVGLGNADNTSDANKPVSTAQATAIALKEASANKDASGGYAGLTLFKINFKNAANTFTSFFTNANTAARTYTFQDRDGTIADTANFTQEAATAPTLVNSWVDYGGGYQAASYWKDPFGNVHLRGLIKSGVVGSAAFTLPVGYRPPAYEQFAVDAAAAHGLLQVQSDGVVVPLVGSNTAFNLSGVTFRAA